MEGIRTPDSPVLPEEEKDPFAQEYALSEGYAMDFFGERYLHLPEIDEKPLDYMYGVPVQVKEDAFMRFVKENKSTPVAMLHVLLANAVQAVHPENDQTVGALVPASYRRHLNAAIPSFAGRLPYLDFRKDSNNECPRLRYRRALSHGLHRHPQRKGFQGISDQGHLAPGIPRSIGVGQDQTRKGIYRRPDGSAIPVRF